MAVFASVITTGETGRGSKFQRISNSSGQNRPSVTDLSLDLVLKFSLVFEISDLDL
jgi:hypothetical protein